MMDKLTTNEYKVLDLLQNGVEPEDGNTHGWIYIEDIEKPLLAAGYTQSQISGYMSALEKKGHLSIQDVGYGNEYYMTCVDACDYHGVEIEVA